ncbi:hypothetical protein AYI69_g10903 [Smittium culicis]|uniref:Uncharacterized protein n=1 Tax=Smittium culicis TaxID=133412 RepID=A0A1R1X2M9_9FUNG|nr:hypothetical protein AYI69_g10903 [Smittium culicis]
MLLISIKLFSHIRGIIFFQTPLKHKAGWIKEVVFGGKKKASIRSTRFEKCLECTDTLSIKTHSGVHS